MPSQSSITSGFFITLTRLVIPPKPITHIKEGNLYVRSKNGRKEFVRKTKDTKRCNMPRPSYGNHRSPSYEMASKSLAELERERALLLEERAIRERLDQQERIGYRTRRPYRMNGSSSFSSSSDSSRPTPVFPEVVPEIVPRHPRQYRQRRRNSHKDPGPGSGRSSDEKPRQHQCPAQCHHPSRGVRFVPEEMRYTHAPAPTPNAYSTSSRRPSCSHSHIHCSSGRHPSRHSVCPHHHGHSHRHQHQHHERHFDYSQDNIDDDHRQETHPLHYFPDMMREHRKRHGSRRPYPGVVIEERRPQDYE